MASRDLKYAVPLLRDAGPKIIADYRLDYPDRNLIIVSVSRMVEEQWNLFLIGRKIGKRADGSWYVVSEDPHRIVTKVDGYRKKSKHIISKDHPLSEALDFGVIVAGKYMAGPKDTYLYEPLRDLAHRYGLAHGTDFPGEWKDMPHVETPLPFYPAGLEVLKGRV